ncbi:7TM diverse intracellular signaling domain-containing protein [Pedobacter sp. CFBP9032]|uniref:7TM diverse intracellular signaling domain-containing protein n=1 Tax=Pedobacter sp. CFBP9032 TaxID=3096539 RepID=UPI002A6B15ED|nr:7TM diverse intracellular signaling domain-containing protein [Pedobacter sp. CFBP9032]MDY0906188.1 7TM diverse intracellular signaling domain-containing protein [Pedobacter sp. CFBP9032]
MQPFFKKILLIISFFLLLISVKSGAQDIVRILDSVPQHIFTFKEIEVLEDPADQFSFEQINSKAFEHAFKASTSSTPQTKKLHKTYWFRIKIKHNQNAEKPFLLEFFDQTIDHITAYIPQENQTYHTESLGDVNAFNKRLINHKNFEIPLKNNGNEVKTYYFKIKSSQISDIIIVLRTAEWFISYALDEYFYFGIFYGMIMVFSFYNLIMFIAIRQKQYLYYVLYNLCVGFFEMSTDGIAYQYLWPNAPGWNQVAYAFALCATSIFALLFTRELLLVKVKAPTINKLIIGVIIFRIIFFIYCYWFDQTLFSFKFIEAIPLAVAFFTGIYIYKNGYKPARFFVLGYSFLFTGFMLKFLIMLGISWLNFGIISYYSLSFCFIMEMVFLSFAIGDKVRILKLNKDKAQQKIIRQMAVNAKLKDTVNRELESKVQERTRDVFHKSLIIESKNQALEEANILLQKQAEEISRMNVLLEHDNEELQTNVEKVTRDRVMNTEVDFDEFSKIYPDKESCYAFLAALKWKNGYHCRKCSNDHYFNGHILNSRRCSKCGYEESVTTFTIFHNTRIPINKAFYMIFLIYSSKGKISSHKLSELLSIRQSTCWTFGSRIKKVMEDRKKTIKKSGRNGWSLLVIE